MLDDLHPSDRRVTTRNKTIAAMLDLKVQGLTWRKIGERYCITGGMAYRIAMENYIPANPEIRQRLGLDGITPTEILEDRLHWVLDL